MKEKVRKKKIIFFPCLVIHGKQREKDKEIFCTVVKDIKFYIS